MSIGKGIINRLNFRIIATVIVLVLMIGFGLNLFVLRFIDEFKVNSIREDLEWTSRFTYNIFDDHYYDLLLSGGLDEEGYRRIHQGKALGDLEDFMRQKNFKAAVYWEEGDELLLSSGFPPEFIRTIEASSEEHTVRAIVFENTDYYIYHSRFEPWDWHLVLLKDVSDFSSLVSRVRNTYTAIVIILFLAAIFLYYFLKLNIDKPIRNIISSLSANVPPKYRGIQEFQYLSDSIRDMMASLEERERRYRLLADNVTDVIWTMDLNLQWTYISPSVVRMRGYTAEEVRERTLEDLITPESYKMAKQVFGEELAKENREGVDPDRIRSLDLQFVHKDGRLIWGEITASMLRDEDGMAIGILGVTRDITARRAAEITLRESEELFRTTFRTSPDSININRLSDGLYIDINEGFTSMSGYTREDVIGRSSIDLDIWVDPQDREKLVEGLTKDGQYLNLEARFRMKNDTIVTGLMSAKVIMLNDEPHILSITRDISELKKAEAEVKASLDEKEILLKEVHHRVKNNLQVISGLLNLQAHHISDHDAREIYKESQNRVITMGLIHEELYQAKDLAHVDFAAYIQNLATNLFVSYGVRPEKVDLVLDTEHIEMVVDTAIPCGLIVNELITNSLKHGFPGDLTGEIRVGFHSVSEGKFLMSVSDNGVGFPADQDFRMTKSLGLQLVTVMTDLLNGTIEMDREGGTTFRILFKEYREAGTELH